MTPAIEIINATAITPEELEPVRRSVEAAFGAVTRVSCECIPTEVAYDESRAQYCSTSIIAILLERRRAPGVRQVAIVDVDLFVPVLSFVFGEAQFRGDSAVVSTYRLSNEFYGIPPDADVHRSRLEKEIMHEIGHLYGLYHCRQFDCVMKSSTYAEEIDLKHAAMCGDCRNLLLGAAHTITTDKADHYERPIQSSM